MAEITLEKDIMILTTKTVEVLLAENPDAIPLYLFYYKTAKRQETNQPFASKDYCLKGLKWGEVRFAKAKKTLEKHGLISQIKRVEPKSKKVIGWYVKLNYIWSKEKTTAIVSTGVDCPEGGKQDPNALSRISKVLKVEKEICETSSQDSFSSLEDNKKEEKEAFKKTCLKLIGWAEQRRGFKFLSTAYGKQMKAFKIAKDNKLSPLQLKNRWVELESDKYWIDNGYDWFNVVNSFNRKK